MMAKSLVLAAATIIERTDRRGVDAVGFEAKGSTLETVPATMKLEGSSGTSRKRPSDARSASSSHRRTVAIGLPEAEIRVALELGRAEEEGWRQRKDGTTVYCSGVTTRLQTGAGRGFAKTARHLSGSKRQELAQENLLSREQQASQAGGQAT